jgi:hypothetical protein
MNNTIKLISQTDQHKYKLIEYKKYYGGKFSRIDKINQTIDFARI